MALGGMSSNFVAGMGVAALGVFLHIVGIATPGWSHGDFHRSTWDIGLFRTCSCSDLNEDLVSDELKAVRAMVIIGAIVALVGVGLLLLFAICLCVGRTFLTKTYLISGIACIVAFVFILIGIIVYGTEVNNDNWDLHYSFGLSITGAVLLLIGGLLVLMAGRSQG